VLLALLLALTVDPAATEAADPAVADAALTAAADPARADSASSDVSDERQLILPVAAPAPDGPSPALRFVWRDHPQLRAGRNFRLDFGAKVQEDARHAGDDPTPFSTWTLNRARAGVDGELFRVIQFSIEREFSENLVNTSTKSSTKSLWKDFYVELNASDAVQIRGGKFKVPFGLDQTSGETNLDFVYRTIGGDYLAPGRDIGGMVHGRFFKRGLNYWAGGFRHDGDNSRSYKTSGTDQVLVGQAGFTVAGRVTGAVFRHMGPQFLREAQVGGSFAGSKVSDEGFLPNGLRARTVMSQNTFFERMFVKGPRRRYSAEIDNNYGPFGARAEYMLVTDARQKQGLGDEDLSNVRGKAWYVQGTWVMTGEKKDRPVEPRKGGLGLGGYGALELTVRFDTARFDSVTGADPPFRNTRAVTIFPSADRVFTGGFTYRANRWVKIQWNAIHESLSDIERAPSPGDANIPIPKFWSNVLRLQFEI
jgi:phosphate-selective porin